MAALRNVGDPGCIGLNPKPSIHLGYGFCWKFEILQYRQSSAAHFHPVTTADLPDRFVRRWFARSSV